MKKDVSKQIEELKKAAEAQGLEVRFRDRETEQGDFCIFIYDKKNFRKSYAVGYDGGWGSTWGTDFESCLKSAYHWIEKRDKRFTIRDGRWQYGHYHFILWMNGTSWDRNYYLTMEDADRAAAIEVERGFCVVCYDEPPTGRGRLAKVYGDYERHCNEYVKQQIKKHNND